MLYSQMIKDAIVHADCYCEPGDPTCTDWRSKEARWDAIHKSVMSVIDPMSIVKPEAPAEELSNRPGPVINDAVPVVSESNLVNHARRELALLNEDPDVVAGYLDMIQRFADMGHSGGSSSVFVPTLNELLNFRNLSALTNDPTEWIDHSDKGADPIWQSRRRADAFSLDGGKNYYTLEESGLNKGRIFHPTKDVMSNAVDK